MGDVGIRDFCRAHMSLFPSSLPKRQSICVCHRGTVLMECVLVLPLLTALIFAVVQFSLIWYAQIMTHYAAYNAARAALVYHPGEYRGTNSQGQVEFFRTKGPCWEAACRTLAWVSSSPAWDATSLGTAGSALGVSGWWATEGGKYAPIPNSSHIENQVRIIGREDDNALSDETWDPPVVKVCVEFDFPLHVPVIGRMLAYFHASTQASANWEPTGWRPEADKMSVADAARHKTMQTDYLPLRSVVLLPKPWKTVRYARRPK